MRKSPLSFVGIFSYYKLYQRSDAMCNNQIGRSGQPGVVQGKKCGQLPVSGALEGSEHNQALWRHIKMERLCRWCGTAVQNGEKPIKLGAQFSKRRSR